MTTSSNFVSKKTILMVDDEYINLLCFSDFLSEAGYEIRIATNGKFALSSIQKARPDLLILDVKMPGMDGYQVYQALKLDEYTRDIPVIFLSGMDRTMDNTEDLATNNVDYLLKPVDLQDLLTHIQQALKQKTD